ncbi:MAG: hypothetical protein JNJ50_19825 [Acidobacteria bacterium]|nr:hypothetical protein [Acidobacteriota bacterium]
MTDKATLYLTLRSAATFGRGDGVTGYIDREVEHDKEGFPFLRGRTLKGLLREAAEEIAFALEPEYDFLSDAERRARQWPWHAALNSLFGVGSSDLDGQGKLQVGDACLPWRLRALAMAGVTHGQGQEAKKLSRQEMLALLTGIRRQTAVNVYGAPDHATLRSMRVILREVSFEAELSFAKALEVDEWSLLVAATLNLRAAGTGRNRGRGWLIATLESEQRTQELFRQFQTALAKKEAA